MERLNYNQLYYFYVVATEGSVKAACEKLHLTQPTISGQLKTFEEWLGFELFERKHRKLVLNQYGKLLLKKAERIFSLGEELVATLPKEGQKIRNDVKIGITPSLHVSLVHDFTLKVWKDQEQTIQIENANMDSLIDMLNKNAIDFILCDSPYEKSKNRYKSINLGTQDLVAVGTEDYKKYKKNFPESLSGAPFLSYTDKSLLRSEIDYFFQINDIKPDVIGTIDDTTLLRLVAEKGLGIAILPELAAKAAIKSRQLIKIGVLPTIKASSWIVTSNLGSRKLFVKKMINDYLIKKK